MKINKDLLYVALSILLLVSSCSKKDNPIATPVASQKLYNVNFSVSNFTSEITTLSSLRSGGLSQSVNQATVSLANQINDLEYMIYNSSGQLLKDSVQHNNGYNFGIINQQLPAGTYKLVVAGMSGPYSLVGSASSSGAAVFPNGILGDWFKQVSDFTVSDQALSQSVILDRILGKVGIVITDAIPKDLAKITLVFSSATFARLNSSSDPQTEIKTVDIPLKVSQEGELNFSASTFVIPLGNGSLTTDVSIRAYNTLGTLLVEKIIKNVVIEKNKMTTLSGALFTSLTAGTTTNVSVNSDWKPTTTVNF